MDLLSVSPWGLLAAFIASVIIGSLWFSPLLFVNPWMKGLGLKKADRPLPITWVVMLLSHAGTALLLASLKAMLGLASVAEMLTIAGALFLVLFALPTLTNSLFGKKNLTVWLIEAGYILVVLLAQALILSFL